LLLREALPLRLQQGLAVGGRQFVNKLPDARAEEVARFLDIPGSQEIV